MAKIACWSGGVLMALLAAGCGGSSGPAMGTERGPCYGNGTCNTGLECLSNTCVKPAASGAAGTSGTGGTAGAGGTATMGGTAGTGATAGAGGSIAGAGGGGGSAAGAGGSTGGSGGSGGSTGGTPNCADYCNAITSMCTGGSEQYSMLSVCQTACPTFPVGTATDSTGDTLGCRYHLLLAGAPATATVCATAGPSGGNVCGSNPCVPYCDLMAAACPSAPYGYASKSDCMTACTTMFQPASGTYSTAATNNRDNGVYCYLAFAVVASMNPTIQCPHAVMNPNNTFCHN